MGKDTKKIIAAIFIVGWLILTALGYWYLGFVLAILYFFLPKTQEQKIKELHYNLLSHFFKKRDWSDKEKVKKEVKGIRRDAKKAEGLQEE